jgi:hypothetical protein
MLNAGGIAVSRNGLGASRALGATFVVAGAAVLAAGTGLWYYADRVYWSESLADQSDVGQMLLWLVGVLAAGVGLVLLTLGAIWLVRPRTRAPRPGWYDDPTSATAMRWWDGKQWSRNTAEMPGRKVG